MAENPCAVPGQAVQILHHQVWRSAGPPHSLGPGNRNVWAGARNAGKLAFRANFPAPVERPESTPVAEQSVSCLTAAARPLHLIHGGASLTSAPFPRVSLIRLARPGPPDGLGEDSALRPPGRLSRPSRWSGRRPEQRATVGQTVDQTVDSAVDSRLSRWITRTFLWISQILRKILRFLARNPCASSPQRSTNSFTARAEVLPGGNSRDAGETRATGKPGNRNFGCCFQVRRRAAERQEAG